MKCPLLWLRDHLETRASYEDIAETLTHIGLTVEGIEWRGAALEGFITARITKIAPHPNADRLRLCEVDLGRGRGKKDVVCGAPNAEVGLVGIFAPVGVVMPQSGKKLKASTIRGVLSEGMLCSEEEIGLGEEGDGIINLQNQKLAPGLAAASALELDEPILDLEVTYNRPDWLGMRGIARELAAAGLGTLKKQKKIAIRSQSSSRIPIRLSFPKSGAPKGGAEACPHFVGREIRGVTMRKSPPWLKRRLELAGLHPVSAPVDITNYIALDRARPLHAYDSDRIQSFISARFAKKGESLAALDGEDYKLDETMCVIADKGSVLGLGGIMGGAASSVHEETTNIFIESAWFDPPHMARTGQRLGIESDARRRFERGVDPLSAEEGCDMAAALIQEICGGVVSKMEKAGKAPKRSRVISFSPQHVKKMTGYAPPRGKSETILTALGCAVQKKKGKHGLLSVRPPSWRGDLQHPADLVEEIMRMEGVEKIPPTPLPRLRSWAEPLLPPLLGLQRECRRALALRGAREIVPWSFIPKKAAGFFTSEKTLTALALDNPISEDMSHMRPSLLPGLVMAAAQNLALGHHDMAFFETGAVFWDSVPEAEHLSIAGARAGLARSQNMGRHWREKSAASLFDAKADLMALLDLCGIDENAYREIPHGAGGDDYWHPRRSGSFVTEDGEALGAFGEIHPDILDALQAPEPLAAFEVSLERLMEAAKTHAPRAPFEALRLHPIRRDFAFLVQKDVPADSVLRAAKKGIGKISCDLRLFDIFEGGGVEEGKKSLAIEVTFYPRAPLDEKRIQKIAENIAGAVEEACGGQLRSA